MVLICCFVFYSWFKVFSVSFKSQNQNPTFQNLIDLIICEEKKFSVLIYFSIFLKSQRKRWNTWPLCTGKKNFVFKHLENDTRREKQGFSLSLTCSPLHFLGIKLKSEQELNVLMWLRGVWRQIQVLTPRLFVCQLQAEQQWNISLKHVDFISKVQTKKLLNSVRGLEPQRLPAFGDC